MFITKDKIYCIDKNGNTNFDETFKNRYNTVFFYRPSMLISMLKEEKEFKNSHHRFNPNQDFYLKYSDIAIKKIDNKWEIIKTRFPKVAIKFNYQRMVEAWNEM